MARIYVSPAREPTLSADRRLKFTEFERRAREIFDGIPAGGSAWEVGGDLFVEREITAREFAAREALFVTVGGEELRVPRPARLGDVHFVYLDGLWDEDYDVALVLVRRRGTWAQLR